MDKDAKCGILLSHCFI